MPSEHDIPTIIPTTSEQEKDIDDAYKLGANAYIKKPASIRDFIEVISKFEQFWFNLAILPSKKKYYSDIRKNS